jgi:hypothetical protein
MSNKPSAETLELMKTAGGVLALHFLRFTKALAAGQPVPEPGDTAAVIETADDVGIALHVIAQELGLRTRQQREHLVGMLTGMGFLIATQGAELECTLHQLTYPDDSCPKAMVMRMRNSVEGRRVDA